MPSAASSPGINPALLRGAELFSAVLEEDLVYAASRSSVISLKKGERLFSTGDRATRFFIVKEGSIRVFRPREDGGEDEMAVFAPRDAIGDFDFARRACFDACAVAVTDSTLLIFPGIGLELDDLARERPAASARILLRSLAMIASRLRSTQVLISENSPWVRELRRRSLEDPGTGLWTKAFLDEEIEGIRKLPFALFMIKPDRFKVLVDSRGHAAGDEAMIRIAGVIKSMIRKLGRGWAVRLKSNEVAVIVPRLSAAEARTVALDFASSLAALEEIPGDGTLPPFMFTASVAYALWPEDSDSWQQFFDATYSALMETWRLGGNRIARIGLGTDGRLGASL